MQATGERLFADAARQKILYRCRVWWSSIRQNSWRVGMSSLAVTTDNTTLPHQSLRLVDWGALWYHGPLATPWRHPAACCTDKLRLRRRTDARRIPGDDKA